MAPAATAAISPAIGFQIPDEYLIMAGGTDLTNIAGDNAWEQPTAQSAPFAVTVTSGGSLNAAKNTNLTFDGLINGTFDVNGNGDTGRIILPHVNNITLGIDVVAGAMNVRDSNALNGTSVTVFSGASVELQADGNPDSSGLAGTYNLFFPDTVSWNIAGTGLNGEGALLNMSGVNKIEGPITIGNGTFTAGATIGVRIPRSRSVQHSARNLERSQPTHR